MEITLAAVEPLETLDGNGKFSADGIPAGTAEVLHYAFYQEVEDALEQGSHI